MGTCSSNGVSNAAAYATLTNRLSIDENHQDGNMSATSRSSRVSVARPETEAAALMELMSPSSRAPVASPFKSTCTRPLFTTGKESRRRSNRKKARAKMYDRRFHWNPVRVRDWPLLTAAPSRAELTLAIFVLVAWWISGQLSIPHLLRQYITGPVARAISWARARLRRSWAGSIGAAAHRSTAAAAAGRGEEASRATSSSRGSLAEAGGANDDRPNAQGPVAFVRALCKRRMSSGTDLHRRTGSSSSAETLRLRTADDVPSGETRSDVSGTKVNGSVGGRSTRWKLAPFTSRRK